MSRLLSSRIAKALRALDFDAEYLAKLRARFDAKWSPEPNTGCHLWHGAMSSNGYGSIGIGSDSVNAAHRVAYLLEHGHIAKGLVLDHLCRNPACVNPAHLEPVTNDENIRRGLHGELHVTCVRGHDLSQPKAKRANGRCAKCCNIHTLESRRRLAGAEVSP